MKNNMLYKPLIFSIFVLFVFSTLLYMVAGSPEATLWSSLGAIIMGIIKTIQWLIAMTMALVICLVVLFAIFFGAVALFERKAAASMLQNFMASLPSWVPQCGVGCCSSSAQAEAEMVAAAKAAEAATQARYNALHTEMKEIHAYVHTTQDLLTDKIGQLTVRIEKLEVMSTDMASQEKLEDMSHDMQNAVDSLSGIQDVVTVMQSSVEQTANQLEAMSPESILGDIPQRVQSLETFEKEQGAIKIPEPIDITPLQDELTQVKETADKALEVATESATISASINQQDILGDIPQRVQSLETFEKEQGAIKIPEPIDITPLQDELTQVKETADKALEVATESATISASVDQQEDDKEEQQDREHRIFSFFDDLADKEKLSKLVASTLDRDMSYNQVLNFIAKEFGGEKGKIISSRPLLTKDYIRQCRKNN